MEAASNLQTLYDAVARDVGLEIGNQESEAKLIESFAKLNSRYREQPHALYGHRVETMFQFVASSLGECAAIVQEDAGFAFTADTETKQPDYRLALRNGTQFFVEVKNCHLASLNKGISFRSDYADGLTRYAKLFNQEIKIAVYWSKLRMWTLVSLSEFSKVGNKVILTMSEAFKRNEMSILGDVHIGTTAPLVLRLNTDAGNPRHIHPSGEVEFTIRNVEFYAGGNKIEENFEKKVFFYLTFYGNWLASEPQAIIEKETLLAVEYRCEPEEPVPNQGFDFIGSLSSMVAKHFDVLTAPHGTIKTLSPSRKPSTLGIRIPDNYKGKQLKLWRMIVHPS